MQNAAYYLVYRSKEPLKITRPSDFARCVAEGKVYAYIHSKERMTREDWVTLAVYSDGTIQEIKGRRHSELGLAAPPK